MTLPSSGPLALSDIQTEFGGSNPIGMNEYYAGGGLVPAGTTGTYGAVPSSGALSIQNFYGTSNYIPIYIEDVFSTYLYTGTGSAQTFTNGVNLSSNGGLVWVKSRSVTGNNWTQDTTRGINSVLYTNLTNAAGNPAGTAVTTFNTTGFSIGTNTNINNSGDTYVSWTFREQPKFFDIVTYTGDGTNNRNIAHNLGSVPGCIMVKRTDSASDWLVYHVAAGGQVSVLNSTFGAGILYTPGNFGNGSTTMVTPTSTVFTVGGTTINASGGTYVAYIFAHNAGGFGLTGSDNVISCGSYVNNATVTLGYEPQWILAKRSDGGAEGWFIFDTMRGMPGSITASGAKYLYANTSGAEASSDFMAVNATGFTPNITSGAGVTYIYIAIRRGPMKVPTTGTSVFSPAIGTTSPPGQVITTGFPTDLTISKARTGTAGFDSYVVDRLRGFSQQTSGVTGQPILNTTNTTAETTGLYPAVYSVTNTSFVRGDNPNTNSVAYWSFGRAPSFFDEVCYTGTGANRTVTHNLAAVPELMIVKNRVNNYGWQVYSGVLANTEYLVLDTTAAKATGATRWNSTTPTSSVFSVGTEASVNASGETYVAYLFASCSGVSKVGSYTGTGATQTVNCGFTAGSRFVLIKATSTTGDWMVWDSARGIVAGNDPYLGLNTQVAEVTTTDWVDTDATGFQLSNAGGNLANSNGVSYLFLAIA